MEGDFDLFTAYVTYWSPFRSSDLYLDRVVIITAAVQFLTRVWNVEITPDPPDPAAKRLCAVTQWLHQAMHKAHPPPRLVGGDARKVDAQATGGRSDAQYAVAVQSACVAIARSRHNTTPPSIDRARVERNG